MLAKLISFLTTRCPLCRFRYGIPAGQDSINRLFSLFFIYPFRCPSCNNRFLALSFLPPRTGPGKKDEGAK
jgi:hypothetical protein